jgi:uncharacterized protein
MSKQYPQKIDVFVHMLPPNYAEVLLGMIPSDSFYQYMRGAPMFNLDTWFKTMESFENMVQVLTLQAPPVESVAGPEKALELSKRANDEIAELVAKYPQRFIAGIATVAMNNPDAALKELERALIRLNMKGVQLFASTHEKPLDSPEFIPIYELLSEHNLPILIHPFRSKTAKEYTCEKESMYHLYHILGWPFETSAAMCRFVFSGILEKLPDLKIVTHHDGAMIPFFESRIIEAQYHRKMTKPVYARLTKPPIEYFKMMYGDTAIRTKPALMCAYYFFGAEHMLFGTDFPHGSQMGVSSVRRSVNGVEQMDVTEEEKQMIFETNSRRLLRLPT